jgi:hypothetical protein
MRLKSLAIKIITGELEDGILGKCLHTNVKQTLETKYELTLNL